jgi:hypothetical protein
LMSINQSATNNNGALIRSDFVVPQPNNKYATVRG